MADVISTDTLNTDGMDLYFAHGLLDKDDATFQGMQIEVLKWLSNGYAKKHYGKNGHERQYNSQAGFKRQIAFGMSHNDSGGGESTDFRHHLAVIPCHEPAIPLLRFLLLP